MTIDLSGIQAALAGKKTYISVALGAAVIAANHFGMLPPNMVPAGLDPANWVSQEYQLLLAATFRAALSPATPPTT